MKNVIKFLFIVIWLGLLPRVISAPVREVEHTSKFWDLQFVTPAERRYQEPAASDIVPDYVDGHEEPGMKPVGPSLGWPVDGPGRWGSFKFWNGLWAAISFTQPDICGAIVTYPTQLDPPGDVGLYRALWLRNRHVVPAEKKGKQVFFRFEKIREGECIVFVNRKRAGVIYRGDGEVDITPFVKFGEDNEFLVFATCNGWNLPSTRVMPGGEREENANKYNPSAGIGRFLFTFGPPQLVYTPEIFVSDVFANTSWRKKMLTVETEIFSARAQTAKVKIEVKDKDEKIVKQLGAPVKLQSGLTIIKPSIPWKDPITWELGRGYMYTLEVSVMDSSGTVIENDPIKFGFREVWRDGKEIMMNGHKQPFRTVYSYGANGNGYDFLAQIGYNTIHMSHVQDKDPTIRKESLEWLSEHGMALVAPTSIIRFDEQGAIWSNPDLARNYELSMGGNLRRYRNWPCIVMCYFGVNNIVPRWSMEPQWTANGGGDGDRSKLVDRTVEIGRKYNPNILYFSHADGACGDVNSHNLYLNFTPLQEREEWMCKWGERGRAPYQAAEFGNPYFQCWYAPGGFSFTEYAAIYFGEEPYLQEPIDLVRRTKPGLYIRRVQFPHYWKLQKEILWRTNRGWRTAGMNGGMVYFNLEEGFGAPGWHYKDKLWNAYQPSCSFSEPVTGHPDWLWPSYDIHQLGNKNFLGYIGGTPLPSDKTHGYRAGETISKQIVMLWDYFEPAGFIAEWKASVGGRQIAAGKTGKMLKISEPFFAPINFKAPNVVKQMNGNIEVIFRNREGGEVFRDTFDFEVYPVRRSDWSQAPSFALYDPMGESHTIMQGLGIKNYHIVTRLKDAEGNSHIVIGKDALDKGAYALNGQRIRDGQRVLILPQTASAWESIGLEGEGTMSRVLFLRDHTNPAFKNVTDTELHDWRGAPRYSASKGEWKGIGYGPVWGKSSLRGPRWMYDMAVAGQTLRTPISIGFIPQVDGEFDLDYSGLLKFVSGKGSVTLCQLEFERRVGLDGAATAVADAVFKDFLFGKETPAERPIFVVGYRATSLVSALGCQYRVLRPGDKVPDNGIVICGPDGNVGMETARSAAGRGVNVVYFQNRAAAVEAGLAPMDPGEMFRVDYDKTNPLLRGLSAAHMRWRDSLGAEIFTKTPEGAKLDMGGLFAEISSGSGKIVFCQIDPESFNSRGATGAQYNNIRMSIARMYQVWARLLTNLGADPGTDPLERLLWAKNRDRTWHAPSLVASAYVPVPTTGMQPSCHQAALSGKIKPGAVASPATAGGLPEVTWDAMLCRPNGEGKSGRINLSKPEGVKDAWLYSVYKISGNAGVEQTFRIENGGGCEKTVYLDGNEVTPQGLNYILMPTSDGRHAVTVVWKRVEGETKITSCVSKNGICDEVASSPQGYVDGVKFYGNFYFPDPYRYTYW